MSGAKLMATSLPGANRRGRLTNMMWVSQPSPIGAAARKCISNSMERSDEYLQRLALHEAAYTVAARICGVAIRPSRRSLRCFVGDLLPGDTYESDQEPFAIIALAGRFALAREGANRDRDELLARDFIFAELVQRYGTFSPAFARQYLATRYAELSDKAEQIVDEHWPAIEAEAARLPSARFNGCAGRTHSCA